MVTNLGGQWSHRFALAAKKIRAGSRWKTLACRLQVEKLTVDQVLTLRQVLALLGLSEALANRVHDLVSV